MQVEMRGIDSVIPYARNPRKNQGLPVDKVASSLKEYGWRQPIVVDSEMVIIVGHTRLMAARKLGMTEVPVHVATGLTPAQVQAYRLADNRIGEESEWDDDLLKIELGDLRDNDFDLALTGFDADEVAAALAEATAEGLTDAEVTPEPPAEPVSELHDVWLLGKHRIVCGSSTTVEAVDKALNGVQPHLMVTDPPYGVEYDADWRNKRVRSDGTPIGGGAIGKVLNDDRVDWSEAWALFPGDVAYVWCAPGPLNCQVQASLEASGFPARMQIVWAKSHFAIGRGDYHAQHENCWYVVRKGAVGHWNGDRKQSTLWSIPKPQKSETGHSTQKPVECMKRPIENNSSPGQAVYEPFSGSGTTIIAAEMTGRCCHAIELNPAYVDVAVTRWQNFTGKTATLEETGETFVEAMARRRPNQPIKAVAQPSSKATQKKAA